MSIEDRVRAYREARDNPQTTRATLGAYRMNLGRTFGTLAVDFEERRQDIDASDEEHRRSVRLFKALQDTAIELGDTLKESR